MLSEISQIQKNKFYGRNLHEPSKIVKLIEAENRMVAANHSGGGEMGKY